MDDIFGGASTYDQTLQLKREIIATGHVTTAETNQSKCHGPSQKLKILGMIYDAVAKRCSLPPQTIERYICRITTILEASSTSKDFEKLVLNFVSVSNVEP